MQLADYKINYYNILLDALTYARHKLDIEGELLANMFITNKTADKVFGLQFNDIHHPIIADLMINKIGWHGLDTKNNNDHYALPIMFYGDRQTYIDYVEYIQYYLKQFGINTLIKIF